MFNHRWKEIESSLVYTASNVQGCFIPRFIPYILTQMTLFNVITGFVKENTKAKSFCGVVKAK